jgi:hypothetical protein
MKPGPQFALLALPFLLWTTPSAAQDGSRGCVTQTLSLLVYIDDNRGSAANLNRNILPPPPPAELPDNTGRPPEPAPTPLPPPAPVDCPTLYLPASDVRAQTACQMAIDLPGARCKRLWSGMTLVIEPFD